MEGLLRIPENERITDWFGDYAMNEIKPGVTKAEIEEKYEEYENLIKAHKNIEGVYIDNIEVEEDNYVHFTAEASGYEYDGLYRIHDPENGVDNMLVSIDYGYENDVFDKQWNNIENFFREYSNFLHEKIKEKDLLRNEKSGNVSETEKWKRFYEKSNDNILEKTVENVQKCTSLSNSISAMEIVGKKEDVIKEIQKFAFTNGYEHMGKIIDKEFFGKPEKIKRWLLSIVNETKDEDMKDEARTYITRLDKISPKFTNQVVSEKINNDPLFSISSRDFMEKRAEGLQEKEDNILDEKNKKQKKQGFDDQRKYDYDALEEKLLSNVREKTLKRKERKEISR